MRRTSEGVSRLYPIRPGQGYFDAGMTGDGRQVLMGLYCPDLVAIFFDASGDLISHEARHLEFMRPGLAQNLARSQKRASHHKPPGSQTPDGLRRGGQGGSSGGSGNQG